MRPIKINSGAIRAAPPGGIKATGRYKMDANAIRMTVNPKLAKASHIGCLPAAHEGKERAFTRLDLCCLIITVSVLLGLAGWKITGERGRIMQCTHNLKKLGQAMQAYAGDHGGELPPACNKLLPATWDSLVTPYLRPDLVNPNSAYAKRELKNAVAPRFLCPSDTLVRPHARTYAMPGNLMQPENWPPGPDVATGIGLVWDKPHAETLLGADTWEQARTNHNILTAIKLSELPDPANTLLLTELVRSDNQLGSQSAATVSGAQQQADQFKGNQSHFHYGRFNYLMVDGHVEWLTPLQTGGMSGTSGIWTIRKED